MAKTKLLDISIREFGAKGLDGASTRKIASAAGTAMSSITYHFGGKEGLYLAAAEDIAERMGEVEDGIDFSCEDDPAVARQLIKTLLSRLIDKVTASKNEGLFIVREQMEPTAAFDRLWSGAMESMWGRASRLISIASGVSDMERCRIVAFTLFGQAIATRATRAGLERMMQGTLDDPALLDRVREVILANADAILDQLATHAERDPA